MNIAVNMLVNTPIRSDTENPVIAEFAEPLPKKNKTIAISIVETFPSRIEVHARLNPICIANWRVLPTRHSSLTLSKIRIFASTAIPKDKTKPARPAKVNVTGINLKIANTISV